MDFNRFILMAENVSDCFIHNNTWHILFSIFLFNIFKRIRNFVTSKHKSLYIYRL